MEDAETHERECTIVMVEIIPAFTNIVYLLPKLLPNTTKQPVFPSNRAGWSVEGRHSNVRAFTVTIDDGGDHLSRKE